MPIIVLLVHIRHFQNVAPLNHYLKIVQPKVRFEFGAMFVEKNHLNGKDV